MAAKKSGISGLMDSSAKKTSSTKSDSPSVALPDNLATHLAAWQEAKRDADLAEAKKIESAEQMLPWIKQKHVELCRAAGKVVSSFKVFAGKAFATFVSTTSFSGMKVDSGAEDILQTIFGERYDDYFKVCPQITIKDSITDDQADKLASALKKSGLLELIVVNPIVKPNERLCQDMLLDAEIAAKVAKAQSEGLLKQKQFLKS